MSRGFSETMSALRKAKKISQRTAAEQLHISQALLSHYENGVREPGLDFLCRACDYYDVSADFLLGRSELMNGHRAEAELRAIAEEMRTLTRQAEECLRDTI